MSMETASQKKAFFHHEKQFWSFFNPINEYGRPQVKFFRLHKVLWQSLCML